MQAERWSQIDALCQAALDHPASERAAFLEAECAGDWTLRQEVEALLVHSVEAEKFMEAPAIESILRALAEEQSGDPTDETIAPHNEPAALGTGHRIGSYQIIEQIGTGGMGEVFLARRADDQFQKQVAIKLIRVGEASPFIIGRFRNERQILASLDHPNIAHLLDGGTTEDGIPYLVMELVQGVPIDLYCDAHRLSTTQRLKLFLEVCAAVQYAHQRLIVHRDLKPSNILVTHEGIPKLLDFGIAKILDPGALGGNLESTLTLFRILTPGYASPEQVRGETITTASDVYSLGVIVYELLTGRSPYGSEKRTPDEISSAVCTFYPEKPSVVVTRPTAGDEALTPTKIAELRDRSTQKLRKRLHGDLDNIVLMALRKEPQRRYSSVELFAADIIRHLDSLPVIAHADSLRYRARKFVARHKAGVSAAIVVSLSLLTGLAVTLREAHIARTQQARAERRFNDVRQLANSFMFEFHDAIQNLPGSTAARKLVVQKALQYLDGLSREAAGNLSLQRELATAYEKLGKIQGYPYEPNLGDTKGSLESFKKAVAIRRSILAESASNHDDEYALANTLDLTSQMSSMSGDSRSTLESAREAVSISERLVKQEPRNLKFLRELGDEYETLGDTYGGTINGTSRADTASSLDAYRKSLAISQAMTQIDPTNAGAERLGAGIAAKMGNALVSTGDRSEAMNYLQQALVSWSRLASDPANITAQRNLAVAQGVVSGVLESNGDFPGALHFAREGMQFDQKAADADPKNVQAHLDLAVDYSSVGELLVRTGHQSEGLQMLERSVAMLEELSAKSPETAGFRGYLAMAAATAGERFADSARYARALLFYRKALATYEQMMTGDPDNGDAKLGLAGTYEKLGKTLLKLRNPVQASDSYQKALSLAEPLTRGVSANQSALYIVADSYSGLGDLYVESASRPDQSATMAHDESNRAREMYSKSMQTWQSVHNPAKVTPNGFDAGDPKLTAAKLARSEAASATLLQTAHAMNP